MTDTQLFKDLQQTNIQLFNLLTEHNHENVVFCNDNDTGLRAIIGIHNTTLGPALGGTRMWSYASDLDALVDVLRLSRGMTFKAAISGLNLGGGKAVIIGDARKMKSEALMRRFGRFVENLSGKYITAEDVGTTTRDMEFIHMETRHVTGIPIPMGGSGDPSPVTAYGTYLGMKAAMKRHTGSDSLEGRKIIVQGCGHVGFYLIELLSKEKAQLMVYDIYPDKVKAVVEEFGAIAISEQQLLSEEADVYSPNALGATLNESSILKLRCAIVAGAANNQLKDEVNDANRLSERGILYAPDFAINAGGLINVSAELEGYDKKRAYQKAEGIYETTMRIFRYADEQHVTTAQAAMKLAQQRIDEIGKLHLKR